MDEINSIISQISNIEKNINELKSIKMNKVDSSFKSFKRFLIYAKPWKWKIIKSSIFSIINKLFDIAPEILFGSSS